MLIFATLHGNLSVELRYGGRLLTVQSALLYLRTMKKLMLSFMLFPLTMLGQCDMEILSFNPYTLDISIAVNSGVDCGSPTDSIGEFLLGVTTDPQLSDYPYSCFYDNGWALLIYPVSFPLVDINAPGAWLQSGDTVSFNVVDAFVAGSDASYCWQEAISDGFFEDQCWVLAITQINDSESWPYEDEGGFEYPDELLYNNIIQFSPFDPNCNTVDTGGGDTGGDGDTDNDGPPDLCEDPSLFIPNAFTPNGDRYNQAFYPVIASPAECWDFWEFQVYNRWGGLMFETDYPGQQWLGDVRGGKHYAPDGVYVWKLRARHRYGKAYEMQGHVTLIR